MNTTRRRFLLGSAAVAAAALAPAPVLALAEPTLRRHIELYEVDGRKHFPVVATNGFLTTRVVLYPFFLDGDGAVVYCFQYQMLAHVGGYKQMAEVLAGIEDQAKEEFQQRLFGNDWMLESANPDDMPRPGEVMRIRFDAPAPADEGGTCSGASCGRVPRYEGIQPGSFVGGWEG